MRFLYIFCLLIVDACLLSAHDLTFHVHNIGQGNCVFATNQHDFIGIFDCGSSSPGAKTGFSKIKPPLEEMTQSLPTGKHYFLIVISHPDIDHFNIAVPQIIKYLNSSDSSDAVFLLVLGGSLEKYFSMERPPVSDHLKEYLVMGEDKVKIISMSHNVNNIDFLEICDKVEAMRHDVQIKEIEEIRKRIDSEIERRIFIDVCIAKLEMLISSTSSTEEKKVETLRQLQSELSNIRAIIELPILLGTHDKIEDAFSQRTISISESSKVAIENKIREDEIKSIEKIIKEKVDAYEYFENSINNLFKSDYSSILDSSRNKLRGYLENTELSSLLEPHHPFYEALQRFQSDFIINILSANAGQSTFIKEGETILKPGVMIDSDPNTNSIIAQVIHSGGGSIVLPGDATGITTNRLLTGNAVDIFKTTHSLASHHGANTHDSNNQDWAQALQSGCVYFSAGLDNQHQHPKCSSVEPYFQHAVLGEEPHSFSCYVEVGEMPPKFLEGLDKTFAHVLSKSKHYIKIKTNALNKCLYNTADMPADKQSYYIHFRK